LRNQPSSPLCACLRRPKRVPYLCSCGWISYPLPTLMQEAGFDPVEETVSFATPSGAITLFRAQKNTGDPT